VKEEFAGDLSNEEDKRKISNKNKLIQTN